MATSTGLSIWAAMLLSWATVCALVGLPISLGQPGWRACGQRKATVNNLTEDDKIMLCIVGAFGAAVLLLALVYNGFAVSLR